MYFDITEGIGIELHPSDLDVSKLMKLKSAGITKISIGIQSFDEKNQKLLDAIDLIFNDLKYDKTDLVRKEANTTHANAHVFRFLNELLYVMDGQNKDSGIVSFTTMWRNKEESSHARISDKCFSSFREVDFKGLKHKINIPCGYDEILTTIYGDYMIPKKGVGIAHSVEFFDLDRDYKYYEDMSKEEFNKLFEL